MRFLVLTAAISFNVPTRRYIPEDSNYIPSFWCGVCRDSTFMTVILNDVNIALFFDIITEHNNKYYNLNKTAEALAVHIRSRYN
jgi:hypothetical protein